MPKYTALVFNKGFTTIASRLLFLYKGGLEIFPGGILKYSHFQILNDNRREEVKSLQSIFVILELASVAISAKLKGSQT